MDSLEQKIRELLLNQDGKYGKFCFCANSTEDMDNLIQHILALLQPADDLTSSPQDSSALLTIEGELAPCPFHGSCRANDGCEDCNVPIVLKVQLAHDLIAIPQRLEQEGWLSPEKAKGMVRLPSEDEMEELIDQAILISYNKYTEHLEDDHIPATSKGRELLKLLQE